MNLVLASASKRRQELLKWLIDGFSIIPADINEESFTKLARTPEELVIKLAIAKAKRLAMNGGVASPVGSTVIFAADTVVILPLHHDTWQVIGKPKDEQEAIEILKTLKGRTHKVYTGICILNKGSMEYITDYEVSSVTFKQIPEKDIEEYVATGSPLDKAGAYGIQEIGPTFVDKFEGSITNIIGLPIAKTAEILTKVGVNLKRDWQKTVINETGYTD